MLGKLLKHEMKACARLLLPLYLVLTFFTIMDRIVLSLDIFEGALFVVSGFVTMMYIVSIVAIVTVSFVIIIHRFYKNLVTDEGYLMFTLPVKSHQLINSKLIASTIWTIASIAVVLLSLLVVFITPERFDLIKEGFRMFMADIERDLGSTGTLILIEIIVMTIISILNNTLQLYASISLGQLFSGHKILGSFAAYIGINTVVQIITTVVLLVGGLIFSKTFEELNALPQIIFPVIILLLIILNVVYYYVTDFVFRKKLNLE